MEIVGYADRLSVAPGETVCFYVSSQRRRYRADVVRLIHGDPNPKGPGFKEEVIPTNVTGDYKGGLQKIYPGSYVCVPPSPLLELPFSFTLYAWVYPTTIGKGVQGILTKGVCDGEGGLGLYVDSGGLLALSINGGSGRTERFRLSVPLSEGCWHAVAGTYDAHRREVCLHQEPVRSLPGDVAASHEHFRSNIRALPPTKNGLLFAGAWCRESTGPARVSKFFNGKIDRPSIFSQALSEAEIISLARGVSPLSFSPSAVAAWDGSKGIGTRTVHDLFPHRLHGRAKNMPARAVTGYNWTGEETDFRNVPEEYAAIHFHDDDLEDAGWRVSFVWNVPSDFRSGVYAARLTSGDRTDHVPFFVRPRKGVPTGCIAFLAPTNSYLAYANEQLTDLPLEMFPNQRREPVSEGDKYTAENRLLSLYDRHSDGSGVCYSNRLRPILNMRPGYYMRAIDCPHQFSADLHLIDWLEQQDEKYDVITDEDLHAEGLNLISSYKVLVTGTHPEYWTGSMLSALENYLEGGGRLRYLGGNGFYWVTGMDANRPHVVEVRRWGGTRSWDAKPGECHLSTTGEPGGMWRSRGKAPQRLVGVGFISQGFDSSAPYRCQAGSTDPRAEFIFEGVDTEELIGNSDSLVLNRGAAGFEIDRVDPELGTPAHALVLATSFGHSDSYQHVIEEVLMSDSQQGGSKNHKVHADMVYFEYPEGGAVFSTGSIAWCGALSQNNYDNSVSTITRNVLRRFSRYEPAS